MSLDPVASPAPALRPVNVPVPRPVTTARTAEATVPAVPAGSVPVIRMDGEPTDPDVTGDSPRAFSVVV